jgi:hypothetical protein
MRSYARPGCARDTKNQADTTVLEVAVPLLRFMAVRYPDVCREIIEKVGTESLDKLEGNLLDEKQKLEKAMLLRENNLLHILIADLAIAQGIHKPSMNDQYCITCVRNFCCQQSCRERKLRMIVYLHRSNGNQDPR